MQAYINIWRPLVPGKEPLPIDQTIEGIMTQDGKTERVCSGFGYGGRDLEYLVPTPLSLAELETLRAELEAHVNVRLDLSQSVWDEDEELEEHELRLSTEPYAL